MLRTGRAEKFQECRRIWLKMGRQLVSLIMIHDGTLLFNVNGLLDFATVRLLLRILMLVRILPPVSGSSHRPSMHGLYKWVETLLSFQRLCTKINFLYLLSFLFL